MPKLLWAHNLKHLSILIKVGFEKFKPTRILLKYYMHNNNNKILLESSRARTIINKQSPSWIRKWIRKWIRFVNIYLKKKPINLVLGSLHHPRSLELLEHRPERAVSWFREC